MFKKVISLFLSLSLIITQPIFAQGVAQLNLAQYLGQARPAAMDIFQPTQLRYFSYDDINNSFRILLDKGDAKDIKDNQLKQEARELMDYFLIGLTLPNDAFWVNLRPDSPDNIIDPELEKTDLGRILIEADLQLKKDTSGLTSPQTPEGKTYWDKLYKKAGELFGTENTTIPTITRPWIVPGEIIVRESGNSAYIYKATLKVLLEQDYLKDSAVYNFSDPRLKELNEYSSQIIRETIVPKLTQEVNSSKRYAKLRQVYYSLVLSRWFKQKYSSLRTTGAPEHQSPGMDYISLIDSGNLTNLIAKEPYDKLTYFKQYQESFAKGEYSLKEPVYTPYSQSIRTYMSGGLGLGNEIIQAISGSNSKVVGSPVERQLLNKENVVVFDNNFEIVKPEQSMALAASPLTVGTVKSTIKINLYAFFNAHNKNRGGNDLDKELKELYHGLNPITKYEELTDWIDKAMNFFNKKEYDAPGSFESMIKNLSEIKEEISQQEKPCSAGPPVGKFITRGVNSNESIDALEELGGRRIEQIEDAARPGTYAYSQSGFLSETDSFKEILKKDNTFVLGENLNHQMLADPLLKVLDYYKNGTEYFEYNGKKFSIQTEFARIPGSIFDDNRWTNLLYTVKKANSDETITETITFSGLLPYYIHDYGFYGGNVAFRLAPQAIIDFFGITASSGLTSESWPSMPFGGIDFTTRAMKIGIEPMGSFADLKLVLPEVANATAIDLDNEFKQIQLMASSGIRPSDNRILEFAAACYYQGEFGARIREITSCLQQAHFLDERLGRESSEALRLATILPEVM